MLKNAREIAGYVHQATMFEGGFSNRLLSQKISSVGLRGREAAFATELTYGSIRYAGLYDRHISAYAGRDMAELDPYVITILRLALHEFWFLKHEPYVVGSQGVSLAKTLAPKFSGWVNAVLRRMLLGTSTPPPSASPYRLERLAQDYSFPTEVAAAFEDALRLSKATNELEAALAAGNEAVPVNFTCLDPELDLADLGRLAQIQPNPYSPLGFSLKKGLPARLMEGRRLRVQDEGSQLVTLALLEAKSIGSAERWLDMCAGIGGKAAILALKAREYGANLLANDLNPKKVQTLKKSVKSLGPVEISCMDARVLSGQYDRVLLDVACTGLGSIRRRPELRWRQSESGLRELLSLQKTLLTRAAKLTRPGGVLAYVTCSPRVEECAGRLRGHKALGLRAMAADKLMESSFGLKRCGAGEGFVQLWPHRHQTDAMFLALLEKVE